MKRVNSFPSQRYLAYSFPWIWLGLLCAGLMLAAGMGLWLLENRSPGARGMRAEGGVLPVVRLTATPTPFAPLPSSPTPIALNSALTSVPVIPLHPAEVAEEAASAEASSEAVIPFWQDFDFSEDGAPMEIHLVDPGKLILGGKPVQMRFSAGMDCVFGSGKACVSLHSDGRYMLLTIHSGISGEGQQLRHALEGTGINTAGLSTAEIGANLDALQGAIASLHQGITNLDYLSVLAAVRIPPERIDDYYALPFSMALDWAAAEDDALRQLMESAEPVIFIETCGWPVVGEAPAEGEYYGTGSIYLIAIGKQ
ncbi:MAG: hypothetical protein ACYDH1_12590 [Anaerolineaceae bacterium]